MVPIDDIVPVLWREAIYEKDAKGHRHINRITYEICVLGALRDKLRCKEVWVVGANQYRDPDDDLPADFEAQAIPYYQALKLPLEADRFIANLQAEMREALRILDAGMPGNVGVKITRKRNKEAWITVTPFDPQPDPPNVVNDSSRDAAARRWFRSIGHEFETAGAATAPRDRLDLRVHAVGEAPTESASPTATRRRLQGKSAAALLNEAQATVAGLTFCFSAAIRVFAAGLRNAGSVP